MKKLVASLGILALVAGFFASCSKNEVEVPANQLVGIIAENNGFVNNAAQVKLLLDRKADKAVTVNLGTYTTAPTFGKQLPASVLSFPETVTIAAGDSVAVVDVSVNPASLEKGKYQAVVGITGSAGADVRSNASSVALNLVHGDLRPHVSLAAGATAVTADAGAVAIMLDTPTETAATVTIGVSSNSEVPAAALSFNPEVALAANSRSAVVEVAVDRSKIDKAGILKAVFEVVSVSDNLIDESEADYFEVFNVVPAATDWQGMFYGPYTNPNNGKLYHAFLVNGVTDAYWDLVRVPKGSVATAADVKDLIMSDQADVEYYADYYSSAYTREQFIPLWLYAGGSALLSVQDPGEYEGFIVGFDENGYATGNYASFEYEIENENPDPLPEYARWIGNWDLDGTPISITQDKVNQTFKIEGLEIGIDKTVEYGLAATAAFDAETGGFTISAQNLGQWTHDDYGAAVDKLCGLVVIEGSTYYVDDPVTLCYVNMASDGKAVWTPGSVDLGDEGASTIYSFVGLKYYWVVSAGAGSYSDGNVSLPATMTKIPEAEEGSVTNGLSPRLTLPERAGGKHSLPASGLDHVSKLVIK